MTDDNNNLDGQGGKTSAKDLLSTTFAELKSLASSDDLSKLFPNGIESVNLEVEQDKSIVSSFRMLFSISASKSSKSLSLANDEEGDDTGVSFNARGHKVIALMMKADLQKRAPKVWEKVQEILDAGDRMLEEAATYPDDIRNAQPETKPFHYIDIPFRDGGPAQPPLPQQPHALSKMEEFSSLLQNSNDPQEKVNSLSWLIHLFGDLHQPLHCIEHISQLHPQGDRGGNSFKLSGSGKNLHSAWDSAINVLSDMGDGQIAESILQEHSRETLNESLQINNPEQWARASFDLARQFAYSIDENSQKPPKLSKSYTTKMQEIGRKQAALAAFRLADRLESILG